MSDPRILLATHLVEVQAFLVAAEVPGVVEAVQYHLRTPGLLDALDPRLDPVRALAEQVGFWAVGEAGDGEAADRLERVLRDPPRGKT